MAGLARGIQETHKGHLEMLSGRGLITQSTLQDNYQQTTSHKSHSPSLISFTMVQYDPFAPLLDNTALPTREKSPSHAHGKSSHHANSGQRLTDF